MIGELMLARMGDEGREAFQEDQRLEDDVGRAVAPGVTELGQEDRLMHHAHVVVMEGIFFRNPPPGKKAPERSHLASPRQH